MSIVATRVRMGDALSAARRRVPAVAGVTAVAAVAVGLGLAAAGLGPWSLAGAAVILLIGLAAVDLALIPVLAMPATLATMRAGGVLSFADLVLAAASVAALIKLRGRGGVALQPLIWAGLAYLVVILPTLILNRFSANYIEWAHELFLVIGSLVVGFVIAREGRAKAAFGLYGLACSAIGVAAGVIALQSFASTGAFQAVYLGDLHKNTIGGMLAAALVIAYARPRWLDWPGWFSNLVLLCSGIGVAASQSRQGMVGALVGVFIVSLRSPAIGRWARRAIWAAGVPIVFLVWQQVSSQLASGNQFNSAYQRLAWYAQSIDVWHSSPIFGVGLRWWYTSTFGVSFQPPNAELEVLTCVGVVGLLGFFAMFAGSSWVLLRIDPMYGTVGAAVVLARFTQAQFDLYWVAGQASLLWIVAGACIGAMVRDAAERPELALAAPAPAPLPSRANPSRPNPPRPNRGALR
jgi:hypothetical protein